MGEPSLAFHLVLKLARAPTRVAGKHLDLAGRRQRLAELDQRVERVAQVQVRDHVRVGNESVGVLEAEDERLHRPPRKSGHIFKRLGQVRDDHIPDVVVGSAVEHQAERALQASCWQMSTTVTRAAWRTLRARKKQIPV